MNDGGTTVSRIDRSLVGGLKENVLSQLEQSLGAGRPSGNGDDSGDHVKRLVDAALRNNRSLDNLSVEKRDGLTRAVIAELTGLGPLEELLEDETLSDILINGPYDVWVDRSGVLEKSHVRFDSEQHLMHVLSRMVERHGRHLGDATPYVDARLADGSRLHVMIPPLSDVGPVAAIRLGRSTPLTVDDLIGGGTLDRSMADFLATAVKRRINTVFSGGAATGKTTLLNVFSRFIPHGERIITIEETREIYPNHPHAVALETRLPNAEGQGEIGLRVLLRNALRMRADRIIVGEVRGDEVFDMLQAMNVGHQGSLTTVHANSPADALLRFETLVLLAGFDVPSRAIRDMLGSAFDLLVHVERFGNGSRKITSICEVGLTPDGFVTRELFKCTPAGQFEAVNIPLLLGRMGLGDEEMTKWFGSLQSSNHA
ncbi:MAG: CpaF family protein [Verrucomicrobiae bacterium]|nr:CpaF family protein [Verrucomicrobiae bacterium]